MTKKTPGSGSRRRAYRRLAELLGLPGKLRELAARASAPASPGEPDPVLPLAGTPLFDRVEVRTLGFSWRILAFSRAAPLPDGWIEALRGLVDGLAAELGPDVHGAYTLTAEDEAELAAGRWRGRTWGEEDPVADLPLLLRQGERGGPTLTVWLNP